eukprot:8505175-Heterocapsa_arctica.AAC.1
MACKSSAFLATNSRNQATKACNQLSQPSLAIKQSTLSTNSRDHSLVTLLLGTEWDYETGMKRV